MSYQNEQELSSGPQFRDTRTVWWMRGFTAAALSLCALMAVVSLHQRNGNQGSGAINSEQKLQGLSPLAVTTFNKYTLRDGKPFLKYYPWLAGKEVLEPHLESNMCVIDAVDGAEYYWSVTENANAASELSGACVAYTCTEFGTMSVKVTEIQDESTRSFEGDWYCKYVRREIRSMFDEDRNAFLNAMETLYEVSDAVGVQLFGPNYRSMDAIVTQHNNLAGAKDCDHAHDGHGFLISHVTLSNVFEKAIQSVNPAVAIPYWDFTIDQHNVDTGVIKTWFDSEVFQDDWLGEANPKDHIITKGRWAYLRIKSHAKSDLHNAYGLLRAPWNSNSSPYVTRCGTLFGVSQPSSQAPTCASHFELLSIDSWMSFSSYVQYKPHGGAHTLIGGMWGASYQELLAPLGYFDEDRLQAITLAAATFVKYMWRSDYLSCPSTCGEDEPEELCKCTCPELESFSDDDVNAVFNSWLSTGSLLKYNDYGEERSREVLKVMCSNMAGVNFIQGDMIESSSPADPSFWPMHPTSDRLWQWKRLTGFKSETWNKVAGECSGHGPDDIQPFQHVAAGQDGLLTNSQLYDILSPLKDGNSYIYEHFEWAHCAEEGYPLNMI